MPSHFLPSSWRTDDLKISALFHREKKILAWVLEVLLSKDAQSNKKDKDISQEALGRGELYTGMTDDLVVGKF